MKYPLIDIATNKVVNIIVLAEGSNWTPPNGHTLGDFGGDIGDFWDGTQYVKPLPPLPKETDYSNAIQLHIDATAQVRQYADGISLASYDSSTNATWAAEAQTFVAWRDQVWAYAFLELEKVKNGQRPQPSIEEFLQELPVISWPQDNTGATGP